MTYEVIMLLVCSGQPISLPASADPVSWHNLKMVARDLGIFEEGPDQLAWRPDFGQEVEWCRRAQQDCVDSGYPFLSDLRRFPRPEYVEECCAFNRMVHKHIDSRKWIIGEGWFRHYDRLMGMCDDSHEAWHRLMEAQRLDKPLYYRRQCLGILRSRVGSGYWSGLMPDPVPRELFRPLP